MTITCPLAYVLFISPQNINFRGEVVTLFWLPVLCPAPSSVPDIRDGWMNSPSKTDRVSASWNLKFQGVVSQTWLHIKIAYRDFWKILMPGPPSKTSSIAGPTAHGALHCIVLHISQVMLMYTCEPWNGLTREVAQSDLCFTKWSRDCRRQADAVQRGYLLHKSNSLQCLSICQELPEQNRWAKHPLIKTSLIAFKLGKNWKEILL